MLSVNSSPTITNITSKPQRDIAFKNRIYSHQLAELEKALERVIAIEKKPPIERTNFEKELLKKFENSLAEIQKKIKKFESKFKPEKRDKFDFDEPKPGKHFRDVFI